MPLPTSAAVGVLPKPSVVTWYAFYCAVMAGVYLVGCAFCVYLLTFPEELVLGHFPPWFLVSVGLLFLVISFGVMLLYVVAPLLPRKRATWLLGFVNIGLGMMSGCSLPLAIPLLILWLRDDTRAYFGTSSR